MYMLVTPWEPARTVSVVYADQRIADQRRIINTAPTRAC